MSIVADFIARLGLAPDEASFEKGDKLLEGIKLGLETLGFYEAAKGLVEMVKGVSEVADHAVKAAQSIGVTTEAVQELGYAAKLSNIPQEDLEISLEHLARNMQEVKKGAGPAYDAFVKLGIGAKDLKGESLDQNLELIADKFSKMPDGATKTALAMDLFGKSGARLIPLLNSGQKGIVELRNEAEELGIVVSGETAKKFEEFNDQQSRLGAAWQGFKTQIVSALLPALSSIVNGMVAWTRANKDLIASIAHGVADGLETLVDGISSVGSGIFKAVQFLREHTDVFYSILIGLGVAIAAFAIQAAIQWAIAFWPFILIVAVIALVTLGLKKLFDYFNGATSTWSEFLTEIKNQFEELGEWVVSIPEKIEHAFGKAWDAIKSAAKAAFEWIKGLPVVKQLIALYDYFTHKTTPEEVKAYNKAGADQAKSFSTFGGVFGNYTTPSASTQNSAPVQVTYAPNLTINPSAQMDEVAIGKAARGEIDKAWAEKMRAANEALKGGVR